MKSKTLKRFTALLLLVALLIATVPMALAAANPWSENDAPTQWAQSYVREAYNQNLVPSNLMGRFGQPITRAEFTALGVALYQSTTGREITGRVTFADTNDVNVQMMAYLGVVRGVGDNRFNPDGLITRQESAAMLSRLISVTGTALPTISPTFADNDAISNWAMGYVGQVRVLGIMGGVGGNRFDPAGRYTIEQSIVTMLRVFQMDELNDFLCGMNLDWVRSGNGPENVREFPGLGADFTIGRYITTDVSSTTTLTWRMLDFSEPHWLYLPSFNVQMVENHLGTQAGDVVLQRGVVYDGRVLQRLLIDLGQAREAWVSRGLPLEDLNPIITEDENWRAYAQFVTWIECTCN